MSQASQDEPTSNLLFTLYNKIDRDDDVFKLDDGSGIQIVRQYKNSSSSYKDKRMFINLFLKGSKLLGGVDIVKKDTERDRWSVVRFDAVKELRNKISNFFFNESEGLIFNFDQKEIFFKNKKYTVNEIVDLMEKNHQSDMFRYQRIRSVIIEQILKLSFFLIDSKYKRINFLLRSESTTEIPDKNIVATLEPDPFFRYFKIHKNIFAVFLGLILPTSYWLSTHLKSDFFSLQNPFLIFLTLSFLLILELLGNFLRSEINKKNGLAKKLAHASVVWNVKLRDHF